MALKIDDFRQAADKGGRIAMIFDDDGRASVRGTGWSWNTWGGSRRDCRDYIERQLIRTPHQWRRVAPERQVDLQLRFQFKEALRDEHGDDVSNLVIRDLSHRYRGFLTALEVKEADALAKKYKEIEAENRKCMERELFASKDLHSSCECSPFFEPFVEDQSVIQPDSDNRKNTGLMVILEKSFQHLSERHEISPDDNTDPDTEDPDRTKTDRFPAMQESAMTPQTAHDPDVYEFFESFARQCITEWTRHHSETIGDQDIKGKLEKAFTAFLKRVRTFYGEYSVQFIQELNCFQRALPEGTTSQDRKFLMEVILHPSMAWWAKTDFGLVHKVLDKVATWYFKHPAMASPADTLWAVEDKDGVDTDYDRQYRDQGMARWDRRPPEEILRRLPSRDGSKTLPDPILAWTNRRPPEEIFARLLSKESSETQGVPNLVQRIEAESLREHLMPTGLNAKEREAYLHLTRVFLPGSKQPLADYRQYVEFVADNIHTIALLNREERSFYEVGSEGYGSITGRLTRAMKGPHDLSKYNAIMRAELAETLHDEQQKAAFLHLTNPEKWRGLFQDSRDYNAYLFVIHGIIGRFVDERQDNTEYDWNDLKRIWQIVTGNELPSDATYSDFVSELIQIAEAAQRSQASPEIAESRQRPGRPPVVPKRVVLRIISDVNDLQAWGSRDGTEQNQALSKTEQEQLCDAVYPWLSSQDPEFIHGFIRGLLELHNARISDPQQAGEAFKSLIEELNESDFLEEVPKFFRTLEEETDSLCGELPEELHGKNREGLLREYQGRLCVTLLPHIAGNDGEFFRDFLKQTKKPWVDAMREDGVQPNSAWAFAGMLDELEAFNGLRLDGDGQSELFPRKKSNESAADAIRALRKRILEMRGQEPKSTARTPDDADREAAALQRVFGLKRVPCQEGSDSFFKAVAQLIGLETQQVVSDLTDSLMKGGESWKPATDHPDVAKMLLSFGLSDHSFRTDKLFNFAQHICELRKEARYGEIPYTVPNLQEIFEPGRLSMVPLMAQLYRRPIGVIQIREVDGHRYGQWAVCNLDWKTGKPLSQQDDKPLVLVFDGKHWDATQPIQKRSHLSNDGDDKNNND